MYERQKANKRVHNTMLMNSKSLLCFLGQHFTLKGCSKFNVEGFLDLTKTNLKLVIEPPLSPVPIVDVAAGSKAHRISARRV